MNWKKFIIFFHIIWFSSAIAGNEQALTLDFQKINTQDALHILARFMHQNIFLSSQITGTTTLYLKVKNHQEAFNLLLAANHLGIKKIGTTWFVAPLDEITKNLEEESKQRLTLEDLSPLLTEIWQIRYAKADDLAKLLQENNNSFFSKRGHIKVDMRTNTLCIQETQKNLQEIKKILNHLDVPVKQILIEARLISIDQDFERELGINFAIKDPTQPSSTSRYSLAVARLPNGSRLDMELAALENQGHGEIISSPSLFTSNQQPALIESGEEIPYQEVSRSGGTAIAFKKAVLSLQVTPQILPNQKVLLQLQVNQDRPSNRMILGVPAIMTRQISTHIQVINGQTIVLGGIYEANEDHATLRTPFLGKIPLVGWLFKQENTQENKRELLIFVTPKIIGMDKEHGTSKT